MEFRLGEYECPGCGNRQSAKRADPRQREFAPPQITTQRDEAAVAVNTAHALPQTQLESLRSTRDYRKLNAKPEKYDPAPGLEKEKMILFAIYVTRVVLTVALALANHKDLVEAGIAADAVGLLLISVALFTPATPLKLVVAYFALVGGGLSFLLTLRIWFMWLLVGSMVSSRLGPLGPLVLKDVTSSFLLVLILSLLAAALQLWLASTLFRDVHRVQVLRGA
jgi:hypothetical protein